MITSTIQAPIYGHPVVSITEHAITLLYPKLTPAEVYTVRRDDPKNGIRLLEALQSKDPAVIHDFVNIMVNGIKRREGPVEDMEVGFTSEDDTTFYKDVEVNDIMGKRIREAFSLGLSLKPFANFLDKLNNNPSNHSVEQLYAFLDHCDLPVTEEGNLLAYKAVRSDWMDKHTGTVQYGLGSVIEMPRNKVVDDPNVSCAAGLHVCSKDYGRFADKLLLVEVDPADVVSVPHDYNHAKMRVCKMKVIAEIQDFKDFTDEPVYDYEDDDDYYDYEDWNYFE